MKIIKFGKNNINADAAPTPAPDTELEPLDNVDRQQANVCNSSLLTYKLAVSVLFQADWNANIATVTKAGLTNGKMI